MIRAHGMEIPQTLAEACASSRTALLVYDMQAGIVRQIEDGARVTANVVAVLHAAREAGIRTIFMRHMSLPNSLLGAAQIRTAMAWQGVREPDEVRPWFLRDSPGFALVPEVAPLPSEAVFDKITMSAFDGTPLDMTLRSCGITTLVVVGIATEIGIEPTVRHAADLGYIPVVVTDACGAGDAEAGERALATLRFHGDAMFTDVAEIRRLLRRT